MAIRTFLAMTAAEMCAAKQIPEQIGWMACHFSPYGTGLSNLPKELPPGSLLILNDRIPIHGHDPERIAAQLQNILSRQGCAGLLLDFQRPGCAETARLAEHLSGRLPVPTAVSADYAGDFDGAVFLPPAPHHLPLVKHLAPWQGREIWLELAIDAEQIAVAETGVSAVPLSPFDIPEWGHREETLHCHYRAEIMEDAVKFTLWRTRENVDALLAEAEGLGVSTAVGLYQELSCRGGS